MFVNLFTFDRKTLFETWFLNCIDGYLDKNYAKESIKKLTKNQPFKLAVSWERFQNNSKAFQFQVQWLDTLIFEFKSKDICMYVDKTWTISWVLRK